MITLLKRLKALYLPFAYIIVSIVAVPIFAFEAIEAAEFIIAQVEPPSSALPTPPSVRQAPATASSKPVDVDPTCEIGDTTRNELCAQWKAADAAMNAANLGWWQLYIGALGVFLSSLTLGAAVWAGVFAKKAAKEAASANDIAKRTDRPWIFVDIRLTRTTQFQGGMLVLPVAVELRNEGSGPAKDVYLRWDAFQASSFNLDAEYQRIVAPPVPQDPIYDAPFRSVSIIERSIGMRLDRRTEDGLTMVVLTVFYRSPHSEEWLHTTVFYALDTPLSEGNLERFHKHENSTKLL